MAGGHLGIVKKSPNGGLESWLDGHAENHYKHNVFERFRILSDAGVAGGHFTIVKQSPNGGLESWVDGHAENHYKHNVLNVFGS